MGKAANVVSDYSGRPVTRPTVAEGGGQLPGQ